MPSPFPGMDPYLEGDLYEEFCQTLAHEISKHLLATLPPRYVALLTRRYVLYDPSVSRLDVPEAEHVIYPDVGAVEKVPVVSVEVQDIANRQLVTAIEILSPVNKTGLGWAEYETKRRDLMLRPVHLLEIDLLWRGRRITLDGEPPPADYYVYLSRFTHRPLTDVWAIRLRGRLPVLPVPLLPPDDDVLLDLQRAADAYYDLVHYERLLDYSATPPPPPLSAVDSVWVKERILQGKNIPQ